MTLETVVSDLTLAVNTLTTSVQDKRTVLDSAAAAAATSLTTTQGLQAQATASAATAAAKATEATNNANQVAAYKTAAAALDTSTTATAAVTNLLPDLLAKKDPARHPFRKKLPTLVLDFERQKCHRYSPSTGFGETPLLPFMTFARNSSATYTGPDGLLKTAAANEPRFDYNPLTGECKGLLIEEQRTNLLTYSNRFDAWNKNGCYITDYLSIDGTISKNLFISTGTDPHAFQMVSVTAGVAYTVSATFKGIGSSIGKDAAIWGLFAGTATGPTVRTTVTLTGNSQRISATFTPTTSGTCYMRIDTPESSAVAGDSVVVSCAQLEAGAFPTSYIPTPATFTGRASTATYLDANGVVQTAASGVARSNAYDYDSDGVLRPIGLLLEASATNQLLYSEQFDNAAWGKALGGVASAPVVTSNYAVAPDGTNTADRIQFALNAGTTINDKSELFQLQTTVVGTIYTQSVWLKTADGSTKIVRLSVNGNSPLLVTVTGVWQRFGNTVTSTVTSSSFRLDLRGTTGTSDSADLLVWGAQQGVGSYPTSYIPTTSAQVTRAADTSTSAQATRVADDAKVDGTKFSDFYNPVQGTLVATATVAYTPTVYPRVACLSNSGGFDESINILLSGPTGKYAASVRVGGVTQADMIVSGSFTLGQTSRTALRIKNNDLAVSSAGAAAVTDTSALLPVCGRLQIGATSSSDLLSGHVARISYYPQPFTNEELQVATSA